MPALNAGVQPQAVQKPKFHFLRKVAKPLDFYLKEKLSTKMIKDIIINNPRRKQRGIEDLTF
jgi:hypothetical protein